MIAKHIAVCLAISFLVLFVFVGCTKYGSPHNARIAQTRGSPAWRCASPPLVECPHPDKKCTGWDSRWIAACSADGRVYKCWFPENRRGEEVDCEETAESYERTITRIAIDRLALETGCAKEKIKILSRTQWTRGMEQAYRMNACGRIFICTSSPRGTNCKLSAIEKE